MISMMGKDYIWVTDLVEMDKANRGLISYDEVYQRLWDPFKKFTGPLAQYVAATKTLHTILQYAIKQERPLVGDIITRRKSRKPYFEEAYRNNLNWLLKGVEGKGIDKRDLQAVAKFRQAASVEGIGLDVLEGRLQALSQDFIEARYRSILSDLERHGLPYRRNTLPPLVFVEFNTRSNCFDEYGHEYVTGKFDVFFVLIQRDKNMRKIMEIKVSDPYLYQQLLGRSLSDVPIQRKHYDLLKVALYNAMGHSLYRSIAMPKITAELFFVRVGQKPKVAEAKTEKAKVIGQKLFKDLVELREVGPEEFKKRREKNGLRST
jgi:hypothetical protein